MQETLLEARGLSFFINRRGILRELDLCALAGRVYGLFGPNGSGKTTLFNLLCGLHRPDSGRIAYYGQRPKRVDPLHVSRLGGGLSRTFQVPVVVDELTVADNLMLAYRFRREGFSSLLYRSRGEKESEASARRRVSECLDRFGLATKADMPAGVLSYGERRLLSNLRAALTGARIILLDEPFANLNSRNTEGLKNFLLALVEDKQRTIILTEHLPDNLLNFAHVLLKLHAQRLEAYDVKAGSPEGLAKLIRGSTYQYE